jgi:hypothetical protein
VGGGAPAGSVGGGAPTGDAARNSSAPLSASGSSPSDNAATAPTSPSGNPPTTGGVIGGYTGVGNPPGSTKDTGGNAVSPPVTGQTAPVQAPAEVRGFAEQPASSSSGLAKTADDGVSTKVVPARPCGTAAHETDGTTTCVGMSGRK